MGPHDAPAQVLAPPPPLLYLDHHASTPCDPAVVEAMAPWWSQEFANPSSRLHRPSLRAAAAVDHARATLAAALGVQPEQVVFTSGATESNNLALKGLAEAELLGGGPRRRFVTLATEHRAVLDPLRHLDRLGFPLVELPVGRDGLVDLDLLAASLGPDVLAVSVMGANNEIGVLQPLAAIAALCRQHGIHLHCDGAQAVGHIPLNPGAIGVDLLSLSGHKLYGPKGVGALVIRPGLAIAPQLHGGNQEQGLRAGTSPVPLIVGLAKAVQLAMADREVRAASLGGLRDRLWQGLAALGGVERNGAATPRLAHNLNVTVGGVDGGALHAGLRRHLAVSSGSACSSGSPSHVLRALGRSRAEAQASIRFGLGRGCTGALIDQALATVAEVLGTIRP